MRWQFVASLGFLLVVSTSSLQAQQAPNPEPPATVKPAGKEPTLNLGGLIQAQAEFGDRGDTRFSNGNDRIYLRRARLTATGHFLESFDFRLELDLSGSLAATSNLRAQLTDGFIQWNRYPAAQVRVGQAKTPFGYEQLVPDAKLPSIERSFANDRLTSGRQVGVQLLGDLADKRLSYQVGAFNGNGVNSSSNDDERFLLAGRVTGVVWKGKAFGQPASWSVGGNALRSTDESVSQAPEFGFDSTPTTPDRDNLFAGKRSAWGVDQQLQLGRFGLWFEYLRARFEPRNNRPADKLDSDGGYLQATYGVIPDRLELLLKVETFDPRRSVDGDDTQTLTAGGSWFFKGHDLKLIANVLSTQGPRNTKDQTKLLLRLQTVF